MEGTMTESSLAAGNEAVLRARFEDAQFFYEADLRQPLEAFLPKLAGAQFHRSLGSLLEKSERVSSLIRPLAELTGLTGAPRSRPPHCTAYGQLHTGPATHVKVLPPVISGATICCCTPEPHSLRVSGWSVVHLRGWPCLLLSAVGLPPGARPRIILGCGPGYVPLRILPVLALKSRGAGPLQ